MFRTLLGGFVCAVVCEAAFADVQIDEALLRGIEARGALLFKLDQAAWHATDAVREKFPHFADSGARGYFVDEDVSGNLTTVFFGESATGYNVVYAVSFADLEISSIQFFPSDRRTELSLKQTAMVTALDTARQQGLGSCSESPFNTVVIPPANLDDPIEVYLLSPQTTNDSLPLGGHYKLSVSAAETPKITAFSKSCLEASLFDARNQPVAGIAYTHLLDSTPTETHVFSSMYAPVPLYVATIQNRQVWRLDNGLISHLGAIPNNSGDAEK